MGGCRLPESAHMSSWGIAVFLLPLLLSNSQTPAAQQPPVLEGYAPSNGPLAGGTLVTITGSGFVTTGSARSKCRFEDAGFGSSISSVNIIHNSTSLTCTLPAIDFLPSSTGANNSHTLRISITAGPGIFSNTEPFLLYNLSLISITGLSPREGINSVQNPILITGAGFLNTSELTCSVQSIPATIVSAIFISSTCLQCVILPYAIPSRVTIDVSLNGQPSGNIPAISPEAVSFIFFASPPVALSCGFTASYASLLLTFDREIEIGSEEEFNSTRLPLCSVLFENSTLATIGTDAQCSWLNNQQRAILIELAPTSSDIDDSSIFNLQNNVIRTRYVEFSRLASGSVAVTLPAQALLPNPVLNAPSVLPVCGNVTFSGSRSENGGYKPLMFAWVVGTQYDSLGQLILDPALSQYIPSGFTTQSQLVIPSEAFNETSYSLQMSVRNFLGYMSVVSISGLVRSQQPLPSIVLLGGERGEHRTSSEIQLEGLLSIPDCFNGSLDDVVYFWRLETAEENDSTFEVVDLARRNINARTTIFILPPNFLQPNISHMATLTVALDNRTADTSLTFLTVFTRLQAVIAGGVHTSWSEADSVMVDGGSSEGIGEREVEGATISDPSFHFLWNCLDANGRECVGQNSLPLDLSNLSLVYPEGYLLQGTYNFTLELQFRGQASSTYQLVSVFPFLVPSVRILPQPGMEFVSVHDRLVIRASVETIVPAVVEWSSVYVNGFAQLELTPSVAMSPTTYDVITNTNEPFIESSPVLFTTNITSPLTNQIALTLRSGSLYPLNWYRFRVQARDERGRVGFAEMDVRTSSLPSIGALSLQPATGGHPLCTVFTLTASGWTDDIGDTPLFYQFGFCNRGNCSGANEQVDWMTGILNRNEISTVLPYPSGGGSNLKLVLRVFDQTGTYRDHSIDLSYSTTRQTSFTDILNLFDEIELLIIQGWWIESFTSFTSLTATIENTPSAVTMTTQEKLVLGSRFVPYLVNIRSYLPVSKSFISHFLSALRMVSSSVGVPLEWEGETADMLEEMVAILNSFESSAVFSKPGIDETESGDIINTYASIILANTEEWNATRIQATNTSQSLIQILPELGFGLCRQKGNFEDRSFIIAKDFATLKTSLISLPSDYQTTESCNGCPFGSEEIASIDFGRSALLQYLHWPCKENDDTERESGYCSGVCVITSQFRHDLNWNGNIYLSLVKSPVVSVSLVNQATGRREEEEEEEDEEEEEGREPITITFPLSSEVFDNGGLACVTWDEATGVWSDQFCTTITVGENAVTCSCIVIRGDFAVIETCPSGYYGNLCTEVCPQGLWGVECARSCDCSNRGTCSAHDGSCDCDPGWIGTRCENVCPEGTWGKFCVEECLCENGGGCGHVNGSCDCTPGWIGRYCNICCPIGFYGDGCTKDCTCRLPSECDKVSGACNCEAGFTGLSCFETCQTGFFGVGCSTECQCHPNGTRSCDPTNGTCYCREDWLGSLCHILVTPPPPTNATTTPPPVPSFQPWWAVVPLLLAAGAVALIILLLVLWRRFRHRRKKVLQVADASMTGSAKLVSGEVASSPSFFGEDDELNMTHAESLKVLVPKGKKLQDMFPGSKQRSSDPLEFTEPARLSDGKLRWQIIHLHPERCKTAPSEPTSPAGGDGGGGDLSPLPAGLDGSPRSTGEDKMVEVAFKRGVYLCPDSTLKELRNAFIDSNQLDSNDSIFRFLRSDVPGDYIEVDTEDETQLSQIQDSLVLRATLYIESIDPVHALLELCSCGKFADLECTDCHRRGYCSQYCQRLDWIHHASSCRAISARRQRRKQRRSARKSQTDSDSNSRASTRRAFTSPSNDFCVCGKESEFECTGCGYQGYCSQDCQLEDWGTHQTQCVARLHSRSGGRQSSVLRNQQLAAVREETDIEMKL